MIRLSRMTDYGVVVMAQMDRRDGLYTAPDLAAATGLPAPTVAKLLKSLARAGLIRSHRGAHGGYSLARGLNAITAADIIEALDGPVALTACVDSTSDACSVESLCPVRGGWEKVNTAIRDALETVSVAELCAPMAFPEPAALKAETDSDRTQIEETA